MSISTAITSPAIGITSQCPPNECWTTEYQSVVSGRNIKPRIGQRTDGKTPSNQFVNNHSTTMVNRGSNNAISAINNGITSTKFAPTSAATMGASAHQIG